MTLDSDSSSENFIDPRGESALLQYELLNTKKGGWHTSIQSYKLL